VAEHGAPPARQHDRASPSQDREVGVPDGVDALVQPEVAPAVEPMLDRALADSRFQQLTPRGDPMKPGWPGTRVIETPHMGV
jgi:hypothetical protein